MRVVKGMVQVDGYTYRVSRLAAGHYEVTRILDDLRVGTFKTVPPMTVNVQGIDETLMLQIARAAIHGAKTSWVGRLHIA
jgi:hypothetical protein